MKNFFLSILLASLVVLGGCKSSQKTQKEESKTLSPPLRDQINPNEVLVSGDIIKENETFFFIIDTIYTRGKSTPVVSKGDKIPIHAENEIKNIKGKLVYQKAKDDLLNWKFIKE